MYRDAFHALAALNSDSEEVVERQDLQKALEKHKAAAEGYFRKTPTVAGKKKFMARQMPFEVFALRKVAKMEERAKAFGIDLADAAGVSPAQEMVYLWNGSKRMDAAQLENASLCLDWDRCTAPEEQVNVVRNTPDENAVRAICKASILRSQERIEDAERLLREDVLRHDQSVTPLTQMQSECHCANMY
jgi:hypothetical protein